MKSIIEHAQKKPAITYPCLMKSTRSGAVVLFTAISTGTCVHAGGDNILGEYSTWAMSNFEPFNGAITLSND
ncbi:MAG: hypothetical protein WC047_09245 [Kiritimatiellales bacterium]